MVAEVSDEIVLDIARPADFLIPKSHLEDSENFYLIDCIIQI